MGRWLRGAPRAGFGGARYDLGDRPRIAERRQEHGVVTAEPAGDDDLELAGPVGERGEPIFGVAVLDQRVVNLAGHVARGMRLVA